MARGRTHALTTVVAAGISGPVLAILARVPIAQAVAVTVGCFAGLLLTPDLDVDQCVHADGLVKRTGGCLLGNLWRLFWWPYAQFIPHRSLLSHWPILGTMIRLIYLLALPTVLWWLVEHFITLPDLPGLSFTPPVWWGVAGLMVADTLHWVLDRFF